jgi:hypothetical protein
LNLNIARQSSKTTHTTGKMSKVRTGVAQAGSSRGGGLRAFGTRRSDLDIDFSLNEPAVVTLLIVACDETSGASTNHEQIWNMSVSERIACLIAIVALTEQARSFNAIAQCESTACRKTIEIELPIANLLELRPKENDRTLFNYSVGERPLAFRRPTGRDQEVWRNTPFVDLESASVAMARSLLSGPSDEIDWNAPLLEMVGAAFEEFDPLASFRVDCYCPHCERTASLPINLQTVCLRRLQHTQRELIYHVDRLATAYGWTEEEIVAIPPSRRQHYLRLIEKRVSA